MMSVWSGLTPQRRIIVIGATVGIFLAVFFLARTATAPRMQLLYSGLERAAAGDVITALEAQGAVFEVRGDAIFVDSTRRDSLRMSLAAEGLPANGGQGYEILDALSGFGTTSQMFDAAYWRAKEGELARTIQASRNVSSARVHISNPSNSPFSRSGISTAAVTVTTPSGVLSATQATAIRYLISSAVTGLTPDQVAVIDSRAGLIPMADDAITSGSGDMRADILRKNITRLLEARVGPGSAVVEVTVETTTEREKIAEKTFDPDSRVAISTDNEERSSRANNAGRGAVTVASNLPEGDTDAGGQNSQSNETTTREVTNFEVSEVFREIIREPGTIRRISVAALIDGIVETNEAGDDDWSPRTADEIENLRDLIASAIGFDEARGDSITVRSMEFPTASTPVEPGQLTFIEKFQIDIMQLVHVGVLAVVSLILGIFVLRPILRDLNNVAGQSNDNELQLTSEIDSFPRLNNSPDSSGSDDLTFPDPMALPDLPSLNGGVDDPTDRLRDAINRRQDDSVEVLGRWMDDPVGVQK